MAGLPEPPPPELFVEDETVPTTVGTTLTGPDAPPAVGPEELLSEIWGDMDGVIGMRISWLTDLRSVGSGTRESSRREKRITRLFSLVRPRWPISKGSCS